MERTSFQVIEDDLTGAAIIDLLRLHAAGMLQSSPPGTCHFLDLDELRRDDLTVWSIWDGESLAGCGALRELDDAHGEIKSMRTAPEHLGRGVGRCMLRHITDAASVRGYRRLSLETGRGEWFGPAIALYESAGFERCGPFAEYDANEFSLFFTLALS